MTSAAPRNPFAPGPGTRPPVLAGREAERRRLRTIVADLRARCAGPVHLLQAPRGMGKTVVEAGPLEARARRIRSTP